MSDVVCILGMHRSGTSMLSHWLQSMGLPIGIDLLRADFSNQKGHFEDTEFLTLHKQLLEEVDFDNSGLFVDSTPRLNGRQNEKIKKLIEKKSKLNSQWGWKEPRTCLFLSAYLSVIPQLNLLTIIRDYRQTISSLLYRDVLRVKALKYGGVRRRLNWELRKNGIIKSVIRNNYENYERSTIIYYDNILKALRASENSNCLVLEFRDLLNHDQNIYNYLTSQWNLKLDYLPFARIYDDKVQIDSKFTDKYGVENSELKNLQSEILNFRSPSWK